MLVPHPHTDTSITLLALGKGSEDIGPKLPQGKGLSSTTGFGENDKQGKQAGF